MNVVLDVDPISPPLTGIGRYTLELARGLAADKRVENVRFFSYGRWVDNPETLLEPDRAAVALRRSIPFRSLARRVYRGLNGWRFMRQMRHLPGYVYHSPNYSLLPFNGPAVVTVHDLSIIRHPGFHPRERVEFLGRELPLALSRAACVVTDSEFVRDELEELFSFPKSRSQSVPLGVDPSFRARSEAEVTATLERFGLRYRAYVLVVATLEPRKNLMRLLQAFASLPDELRRSFPLVLAGMRGWHVSEIREEIDKRVAAGEAIPLGFVDEADLPNLYSGAALFAFPSLYEGFGLPALEAMAAGTPVVASAVSSLPEVVGDAAAMVDPLSVESIAEGLRGLMTSESRRAELARLGLARAAQFTWRRCVERTVDVYQRVG